jgi:transposase InsO family protein
MTQTKKDLMLEQKQTKLLNALDLSLKSKEERKRITTQDPRIANFKLVQQKNGTQLIHTKDNVADPQLNSKNEIIKDVDNFRQLNSFLKTEAKKVELRDSIKNKTNTDPRLANFKVVANKLIYKTDHTTLQVPITDAQLKGVLETEFVEHGAGKGIMLFYKHLQTKYLGITRKQVSDFLNTRMGYVLSRPAPHKTNKPIISKSLNELWSIDLIDMHPTTDTDITGGDISIRKSTRTKTPSLKERITAQDKEDNINMTKKQLDDRPYRYIFTCVDVFSRKVWLEPLKGKYTLYDTMPALKSIIQRAGVQPRHIMVDNGVEFMLNFKKFCDDSNPKIKLRRTRTYSPQANGIVEAENKQVRRVLNELLLQHQHTEWFDQLTKVEDLRNNSYHRLLKDTPNNVFNSGDNLAVYGNVLANALDRMDKYHDTEFQVGDRVFVAMKTIYSKIREVYKSGHQKLLAVLYHPRILEITKAGRRNALQRKRYVVTEISGERRTLCHVKSKKPVYVYANELHIATIIESDITISADEALYMDEVERTPLHDLIWINKNN